MSFTHLHVHTPYSLLDGAARIEKLIDRTVELGMESIAITDHGAMFGVIDFYKAAKAREIKPIIGCEVYTASRSMKDKDSSKDRNQGHLVLLAKNSEGYKNLTKIVSDAYIKGFYYKPRVDKDLLRKYSDGLIALSACLAGDVQRKLLDGDYAGARKEALDLKEMFAEGDFYLEIQNQFLEEEDRIYSDMINLSHEIGVPLVATNDVHYVDKKDAEAHDILLCIQTGKTVNEPDRMRFPNNEFYLKSEEEMRKLFPDLPNAIDITQEIVDKCNVDFEFGTLHLPDFFAPDGKSNKDYLRELCEEGLVHRYGSDKDKHMERLNYELNTIEQMGYVEYFLIVWDFIRYAKDNGIPVGPGRGSAAGSIVAYSLDITDIDPIEYSLIFERFLNPERISMPDIDIDFCYERRDEVIDYVKEKYGEDHVAQIVTFGTLQPKAAIKDVGRAMDIEYSNVTKVTKMIPDKLGISIDDALTTSTELKAEYDGNNTVRKLIDTARELEGLPRHTGTHAAGVVIAKGSIDEYVPLYTQDKGVSTQFPMTTIEELGLLKMDFLGLKTLTVIRDAIEMVEKNHKVRIDFSKIKYNDPKVYELISRGNTQGVFQLESSGMTAFMKSLKPNCFEDIIAGVALYRPGPMDSIPKYIQNKNNEAGITYEDKSLEPILSVTYGCLIYQEQVMQIVRDLAGYSYGRSDIVRRAMGKKKKDVMLKEEVDFIDGCVKNGISKNTAKKVFEEMLSFAEYAFNKSHAAAYAVVAFETAYLKTYYPVEYMTALMTSVMGESANIYKYVRNCLEMGIEVLPPCVKASQKKFSVEDGKIRFGLLGIKGVGEGAIEAIIKAREENEINNIFDFIRNVDISKLNKKALEGLIRAGAMDCFDTNRAKHMAVYEGLIEREQNNARKVVDGQLDIFSLIQDEMGALGSENTLPDVEDFPKHVKLNWEKETLGIYLTDHPLEEYKDIIDMVANISAEEINDHKENPKIKDEMPVLMVGIITSKKILITRKNTQMAFLGLEDSTSNVEVIVFPGMFEKFSDIIDEDKIVVVRGKLSLKDEDGVKVIAEKITPIEIVRGFYNRKKGAAVNE